MFCPNCSTEYREGFTVCADCNVPLVNELPRQIEPELMKPITVYRTGDTAFITYVESILRSVGINCCIKGEGLQELFAGGRFGTGYNPVTGPVEIQVDKRDAERAKDILSLIEKAQVEEDVPEPSEVYSSDCHSEEHEDNSTNKRQKVKDLLKGVIVGVLVVSSIVFYLYPEYAQSNFSGVKEFDTNNDSKPDLFCTYKNGVLVSSTEDHNFDGKPDTWFAYRHNIVDQCRSDANFDGRPDIALYYRNGIITRVEIDTNLDDKPEIIEDYANGILSVKSWYNESSSFLWKKADFIDGIMREVQTDRDYDGKFDSRIIYDSSERPVKTELLP